MIDRIEAYVEENRERYVGLLKEFLRIRSISTDPSQGAAMREAAEWVRRQLTEAGIEAEVVETGGHPAVLGDSGPVEGGGPVLLVYGHYDVQPAEDESQWDSPPFEPTVREDVVYARGAADNKGQLLTHVLSAEAWTRVSGSLPVRLKFLIEGEEEIGSPHLGPTIEAQAGRLACDYVVISDTAKLSAQQPAITYGTRGMVYKEIVLTGPKQDLHSGSFGGTVRNPGNALAAIIAGLKDENDRVTIPGFYDEVRALTPQERQAMTALPFDEQAYLESLGSPALYGEAGFGTLERRWARPTLDVCGLYGGFAGEGSSTIIPARVGAKVSMRLVPDQRPDRISAAFDEAVQALTPEGVRLEIKSHAQAAAYLCPLDCPGLQAAGAAVEAGYGVEPALTREGGTLPILPLFRQVLGAESIMMGFCDPNCNAHGPNEFFAIKDLMCGVRTSAHFLGRMARG